MKSWIGNNLKKNEELAGDWNRIQSGLERIEARLESFLRARCACGDRR